MTTDKEKKEIQVFLQIDNVRVVGFDDKNVTVERIELTKRPGEEEKYRWRFKGYYPSVFKALKAIMTKEWLIDKNTVSDLETHLKQVIDSNNKILTKLEEINHG